MDKDIEKIQEAIRQIDEMREAILEIEEALRLIEKLSIHKKFLHGLPFKDLEEIKKILES